jgi:hypothetical protein
MGFSLLSQTFNNKPLALLKPVRIPSRAQVTSRAGIGWNVCSVGNALLSQRHAEDCLRLLRHLNPHTSRAGSHCTDAAIAGWWEMKPDEPDGKKTHSPDEPNVPNPPYCDSPRSLLSPSRRGDTRAHALAVARFIGRCCGAEHGNRGISHAPCAPSPAQSCVRRGYKIGAGAREAKLGKICAAELMKTNH